MLTYGSKFSNFRPLNQESNSALSTASGVITTDLNINRCRDKYVSGFFFQKLEDRK
jgi:hypothetical protein